MRNWMCVLALAAMGCSSGPSEAVWLQQAGFGWNGFGHRVSRWTAGVDDTGFYVANIGGTSTTGEVTTTTTTGNLDDGGTSESGCACSADTKTPPLGWAALLLLGLVRRRRN